MSSSSTCSAAGCGAVTDGDHVTCPACGAATMNARTLRRTGWVLLIVGALLVGAMGTIMIFMYPTLSHPGQSVSGGMRFTGSAAQAALVLNVFKLVFGFGALSFATGLWQVVTGRRSMALLLATLVVAAVLFYAARTTTTSFGP